MKDVIHIEELRGSRFDLALDQLETGLGFEYQGVWFRKEHGRLCCEALSPVSAGSLTETMASALIEVARSSFIELQAKSRFNSLTIGLMVRFCVIEDYGTGTGVIVELLGNELLWAK